MGRIYVESTYASRGEEPPEPEFDAEAVLGQLSEEQVEQLVEQLDQAALAKIEELEAKVAELEAAATKEPEGGDAGAGEPVKEPAGGTGDSGTVPVKEPAKKAAPAPPKK